MQAELLVGVQNWAVSQRQLRQQSQKRHFEEFIIHNILNALSRVAHHFQFVSIYTVIRIDLKQDLKYKKIQSINAQFAIFCCFFYFFRGFHQLKLQMSLGGKLRIDPQSGKISLTRTLKNCPNCQHYSRETHQLKHQIFNFSQELTYHRKRQQQMNILCQQVAKTKAKLEQKFSLRQRQLSQTIGSSAEFEGSGEVGNILEFGKGFTDRLKPISMHSLDRAKYKQLSTERSWNL